MARYVPPKGGVGDVDPEHIESAIPCAASVKVERDPEIRVPIKAEAAHWASGTQSNLSKKFFNPSYPQPSSSSVCIRGSGSAVNQPLRNGGNQSMGKVQINQPNDAVDNHFSNDFYETSAVGTEANHVTIQPVDYSIPMLFQQTARTTAPAAVSSGTAGAVASLSVADGNYGNCESAGFNFAIDSLYNTPFDLVKICPSERAEGTSSNCTPSVQVSDDDLLFDPDSECFDQLLDSLEAPYNIGGNGAPSSSCHVPLYMASRGVVAGAVEDQPSLFAAQFERFRSDSLDDVYALCADLF